MELTTIIWLIAVIVFTIIEAETVQLVCIWFAAAALVSFIASLAGVPLWLQIALFILSSVLLLVFTRPLAKRLMNRPVVPTNADRAIGAHAVVTDEINNECAAGGVSINGQLWSARSSDNAIIPAGARVVVRSIEGVKVIVDVLEEAVTNI